MKLTFTTSLLLLSAATASSTNGGGLRSRRLSLFAEDSTTVASGKNIPSAKSKKDEKKKEDEKTEDKEDNKEKGGKSSSSKAEKKGNVIGGSKGAKAASANMKVEKGRPPSGIKTLDDVYYVGESIQGIFELPSQATERRLQVLEEEEEDILVETVLEEAVPEEDESQVEIVMTDPEESTTTDVGNVQVHLYQYMGRPNCDGADPILSVDVTTTGAEDGSTVGSFSIPTTEALKVSGTGYDLFVMDESGCNVIIGPEAVTITLSPEEQAAEDAAAEEEAKKDKTAMKKSQKKKASKKKTYKKKEKKVDSETVTILSKEALPEDAYEMTTDKEEYEPDDLILVNYSITAAPEATAEGRRLKQRKNNKKDKEDKKEDQPESEPEPIAVTDELAEEDLPPAPVVDQPEPDFQPDPLDSEDEEDEEGEQQPDLLPTDLAIEEETKVDSTDITTYRLGVFMKMANPQGGKLLPLHEVPLCPSEKCTAEEVSTGTITISAADIDTAKYGNGYDVWILDPTGDGIAGPKTISIYA